MIFCVINKTVKLLSYTLFLRTVFCSRGWLRLNRGWMVMDNVSGEGFIVNTFLFLLDCSSVLGFLRE